MSSSSISSSRGRPGPSSTVPAGIVAKLSCAVENREKAEQARREQEARERFAQRQHDEQVAWVRQKSAAARLRNESYNGLAVDDLVVLQSNQARADAVASENVALELERQRRRDEHLQRARANVSKMRGNDSRLDAREEAAAEAARQKGTRDRLSLNRAADAARATRAAENKARARLIREETQRAVALRASEVADNKRRSALQAKADLAHWQEERRREEERRLSNAAACRANALAYRAGAAMARDEMMQQRQEDAREDTRIYRVQVAGLAFEREAAVHANQTRNKAQIASRTQSGLQAAARLADTSARVHSTIGLEARENAGRANDGKPLLTKGGLNLSKEVAAANAALYRRIRNVAARTDDDVSDEAAGAARAGMAAESYARKEAEAKELAQKNEVLKERIASAVSKTDDGDGLDIVPDNYAERLSVEDLTRIAKDTHAK